MTTIAKPMLDSINPDRALPYLRRRLPVRRAGLPRPADHDEMKEHDDGRTRRGEGPEDRGLPLR